MLCHRISRRTYNAQDGVFTTQQTDFHRKVFVGRLKLVWLLCRGSERIHPLQHTSCVAYQAACEGTSVCLGQGLVRVRGLVSGLL